ncbi:Protein of unknown function [Pyronema omphalodes CBS 100304]|uniref:Uncharacterized protein n=1 Tax=Pyronema omphalodes (strain CBS 100304) TaxID=1076935 RepID=U4LUF6_PYROM|nr:Protein of unknown function [Pyronema omphalodes CBS 100304]
MGTDPGGQEGSFYDSLTSQVRQFRFDGKSMRRRKTGPIKSDGWWTTYTLNKAAASSGKVRQKQREMEDSCMATSNSIASTARTITPTRLDTVRHRPTPPDTTYHSISNDGSSTMNWVYRSNYHGSVEG